MKHRQRKIGGRYVAWLRGAFVRAGKKPIAAKKERPGEASCHSNAVRMQAV